MKLRVLAASISLLIFSGCSPSDVNPRTVKERLEAGEAVHFTELGYRRPACGDHIEDAKFFPVREEEGKQVVLGGVHSALFAGYSGILPSRRGCPRIGSTVTLSSGAKVKITGFTLVKLPHLQQSHLKGRVYANSAAFSRAKTEVASFMQERHENIVFIVHFHYIPGSDPNEKAIRDEDATNPQYVETTQDGEMLPTLERGCSAAGWADVRMPQHLHEQILSGELRSWYRLGDQNCTKHGAVLPLVTGHPDEPPSGVIKVTKIKRFKARLIRKEYFNVDDRQFQAILDHLADKNDVEWMTVMDFEPVSAEGVE